MTKYVVVGLIVAGCLALAWHLARKQQAIDEMRRENMDDA